MSDKATLEKVVALHFVPNCYINPEMCSNAVDNCPHALWFVPECYITQTMWDKTVYTHPRTIKYVLQCYKTRKMCYKAVYRCFISFDSISDQRKSQDTLTELFL